MALQIQITQVRYLYLDLVMQLLPRPKSRRAENPQYSRDTLQVFGRPPRVDVSRRGRRSEATIRHGIRGFQGQSRRRRIEDAELHHDRAPFAGVERALEAIPEIDRFLGRAQIRRNTRFRQAIGVPVRSIMERRGSKKTGRKRSLGTRAKVSPGTPAHNTGGLAFWLIRAERYERFAGMPYEAVISRSKTLPAPAPRRLKTKHAAGH